MEVLEGKLTNQEVAELLREQADVLQKYIDGKRNPAISRQRPTERRTRIQESMLYDAKKMELLQMILRALSYAHKSMRILQFPHLEDIRNKKQIQTLLLILEIRKNNWAIEKYIDANEDTLERMSIFSEFDWKKAYKQLLSLLIEYEHHKSKEKIELNEMKLLELEAQAELELLRMESQQKGNSVDGNSRATAKPYPIIPEQIGTLDGKDEKTIPEIKLTYKVDSPLTHKKIISSKDGVDFFRLLFEEDTIELQEQFVVLYMNRANKIIGYNFHSKGGLTGTIVDLRIIFAAALKCLATAIIICHNHPSGNLTASEQDIKLTQRIRETGKIIDIVLLDHIILTKDSHYSFADEGLINH